MSEGVEKPQQLGFQTVGHFRCVVGGKPHYSGGHGNVQVA